MASEESRFLLAALILLLATSLVTILVTEGSTSAPSPEKGDVIINNYNAILNETLLREEHTYHVEKDGIPYALQVMGCSLIGPYD